MTSTVSKIFQTTLGLIFVASMPATPALAADDSGIAPSTKVSNPPPAEFSPLTSSERLRNYLIRLADPEAIFRSVGAAGITQWTGTPKEWGGGAEAFGKRVGNAEAIHVIDSTLRYGIAAALHEDNRYFVSHESGFLRRTKYAIKSTFLARRDNGSQRLSFSRLGGAAGASFISREWQPRSTTSAGDGAVTFGLTIASDVGFNVFREFFPDMKKRFHKE